MTSKWNFSYTGVPQGSLLSPLIFLIFTTDTTTEEVEQLQATPQESKSVDDFNFWRKGKYFYSLLIQIQIAIINLQSWCKKWQIEMNLTKTKCMVFYDKKKLLPPPSLPFVTDEVPVSKVSNKRALGIIIDEDLFISDIKNHETTPTEALETELSILPFGLRTQQLQCHEAGKLLTKEKEYIKANMEEQSHKQKFESPFCNLRSLAKQLIQHIAQTKKCNMKQIQMPVETPATFEIFDIPNLTTILPEPIMILDIEFRYQKRNDDFRRWFCPIKPRSSKCRSGH